MEEQQDAEAGMAANASADPPLPAGAAAATGGSLLRHRAAAAAKPSSAAAAANPSLSPSPPRPSLAARLRTARDTARRPDVVTLKTLPPKWRALQSRWRYLHALTFYVGFPSHVLARVWPALLVNMLVAALVAADHLARAYAQRALLPDLNADVVRSLDPFARYMMFSVSLLLVIRLNRVYDRWQVARSSFAQIGSAALAICQRFDAWAGAHEDDEGDEADQVGAKGGGAESGGVPRDGDGDGGDSGGGRSWRRRLCEDACRWSVVWHHAALQVLMGRARIAERAVGWLHRDELELYGRSRKGRQMAVLKLLQLFRAADFEAPVLLSVEGALQRGVQAQGACTSIRLQAMPYSLSLLSTGFMEVFLLLLPLSSLGTTAGGGAMGAALAGAGAEAGAAAGSPRPSLLAQHEPERPHTKAEALFTAFVLLLVFFFINLLFLAADEVANQLEQPFDWLPADDMVDSTARDCVRALAEARELRALDRRAAAAAARTARGGGGGAAAAQAAGAAAAGGAVRPICGGGGRRAPPQPPPRGAPRPLGELPPG
jgi:predicted membrane chloride channel (bestrophin family)